jgi:hypothetical protein
VNGGHYPGRERSKRRVGADLLAGGGESPEASASREPPQRSHVRTIAFVNPSP